MRNGIGRRPFIAMLAGACVATTAARAQKMWRLGVLLYSTPELESNFRTLRRALTELGYVEARNLLLEARGAEGRPERVGGLTEALMRANPDALFALGGDVTLPALKIARTVPLVFATSADPVQDGIVASLARPGGNATGVTFLSDHLAAKRLEILKEAVPTATRVAFLWNPDHRDNELPEAQRAASALQVDLKPMAMRSPREIDDVLRAAHEENARALYIVSSRLTSRNLKRFVDFAAAHRLPLIGGWGAWTEAGALLSFGPNLDDMTRRAATYVDKIFKGSKPADLPVQQPTHFELAINLKTAKQLNLDIAQSLIVRADKVIE
jgi:putative ABC transport system substrate-binding protein